MRDISECVHESYASEAHECIAIAHTHAQGAQQKIITRPALIGV